MNRLSCTFPLANKAPIRLAELTVEGHVVPILELRGDIVWFAEHLTDILPKDHNRVRDHGLWRALHVRPDAWWIIGEARSGFQNLLGARAYANQCLLTDISHSRVCIRLSGSAARQVLAKGTPLDLRAAHFPSSQCATTWCAGTTVVIEARRTDIDLYVSSSLATAFWEWLVDAAADYRR
jgi:heterotetrameric sarcosine oxidase gamma subunit